MITGTGAARGCTGPGITTLGTRLGIHLGTDTITIIADGTTRAGATFT